MIWTYVFYTQNKCNTPIEIYNLPTSYLPTNQPTYEWLNLNLLQLT